PAIVLGMGRRLTVVAVVVGLGVLVSAAPAAADTPYPPADGRCVDTAGMLGAGMCPRVTAALLADERSTASADEIAVAIVPTTGGTPIESWATGLFNTWGVGKKGVDNGVLLVVAVNDHRVRIATGRGLGARLSDGQASEIVNATITPEFRAGRYPSGVLAGLGPIRPPLA